MEGQKIVSWKVSLGGKGDRWQGGTQPQPFHLAPRIVPCQPVFRVSHPVVEHRPSAILHVFKGYLEIIHVELTNKHVAVIGGGTGIGAGIARHLAEAGAKVTVGGRRPQPLQSVAESVDSPHPIRTQAIDVADDSSIRQFFNDHHDAVGDVDILVNSAGINIASRTMTEMTADQWDKVLRINATGAHRCIAEVLPAMRRRRDGLIVQISSIAGKRALTLGGVVYCASKFAMTALGTGVSNEVRHEGVRVTNVYPGEVDTPLLEQRPEPVSRERRQAMLQPEDVAAMVVAICRLPARAHVPEIVIKPTVQEWV